MHQLAFPSPHDIARQLLHVPGLGDRCSDRLDSESVVCVQQGVTLRTAMTLARQLRQRSLDQRLGAFCRFTPSKPDMSYGSLPAGIGRMLSPNAFLLLFFSL